MSHHQDIRLNFLVTMPGPLTFAAAIDAAFSWAVGRVGDTAGAHLKRLLKNRAAKAELVEIATRATEAAIGVAPELADGLRSEAYLQHVLAPALIETLRDPTQGLTPADLAKSFAQRFVEPYLRGRNLEDILTQVFRTDPLRFEAAFVALLTAFRSELYTSTHWREPIRDLAIEEVRMGVQGLTRTLRETKTASVGVDAALADAKAGSSDLRAWPQTIRGLHLDRPELEVLLERVRGNPGAATLLVGPSGAGKSALLAQLTQRLEDEGMAVLAIKADLLPPHVTSLADVSGALGMSGDLVAEMEALAQAGPLVLIIDQLDAVSEVMDLSSNRMRLMLRLATRWRGRQPGDTSPPVHAVVSSRPFEASHDARFQTLGAKEVALTLPTWENVAALLGGLGFDPEAAPTGLRETLRRPFMLKLYVDLAHRGEPLGGLVEGDLLNAWLATAQLGSSAERAEVVELLEQLAREMTSTETLWRPADRFDFKNYAAVKRAEACELIVRKERLLGFSHQSWLDDFQARSFVSGRQLAEHAWSTQDGLFGRATILRAMERLRAVEPAAYEATLDLLLGDPRTRRHVRHLVVDFVATQGTPTPRECGWVQRLIAEDKVLARRAIAKTVDRWAGWRSTLKGNIASLAQQDDMVWSAVGMSIAEAKFDAEAGDELIAGVWAAEDRDTFVFDVIWRSALWSPAVRRRVEGIFARHPSQGSMVAHYASDLADGGRAAEAAELVGVYVRGVEYDRNRGLKLYGLEKVVAGAPLAFAREILPWFAQLVQEGVQEPPRVQDVYPAARNLPLDWQEDHDEHGSVFGCLQTSLNAVANQNPTEFLAFAQTLSVIEVEEIQAMLAEGFAAGGAVLAEAAFTWLLADPRRFHVGIAHVQDEEGVGQLVHDWSTRLLMREMSPHLSIDQLHALVGAIEAWNPYLELAAAETQPDDRRRMRSYAEHTRIPLLASLPPAALTARRRRQVEEEMATRPRLKETRGKLMASWVPSPMTEKQMVRASDDDLFGMLDEVHDQSSRFERSGRRSFMTGGVSQLAQAFGAFSKENPERAMRLALDKFQAGRHEHVAGAMVRELGQHDQVDSNVLILLIRTLVGRGFVSEDFRRDVAWALDAIARRAGGLEDAELTLLESWVIEDADVIADRTARRKDLDQQNRERNKPKEPQPPRACLFGRGLGGLGILPQGNYTFLSAVGSGLLCRPEPDHKGWLVVLERHVLRPEDPQVWTTLLTHYGWSLYWADRPRVEALFWTLVDRHPEALGPESSHYVWRYRQLIPADLRLPIILGWYAQGGAEGQQLAGEYALASRLVDPADEPMALLAEAFLNREGDAAQLGAVFAAAAGWRQNDDEIRARAHLILTDLAPRARGAIADAASSAVDEERNLAPDSSTRELLEHVRDNAALLKASLNHRFADALQELLLNPGFEPLVLELSERSADILLADRPERTGGLIDQDFVAIAVSLQRSTGELRGRAMDLYERLLDAGVYGADQAAKASLAR